MAYSIADLVALAQSVGMADPATGAAIAMAESGGNPDAVGDLAITPPDGSVGLWQINVAAHPQYTAAALHDPTTNARAALAISNGGVSWSPWSTFTSGAYLKYLPDAQAAAGVPLALPVAKVAAILAGGIGVWWLIEHGYLDNALAGAKRLAHRARELLPG